MAQPGAAPFAAPWRLLRGRVRHALSSYRVELAVLAPARDAASGPASGGVPEGAPGAVPGAAPGLGLMRMPAFWVVLGCWWPGACGWG